MTPGNSNSTGWASWVKWLVGAIIAVLAAGTGIVALLNYADNKKQEIQQQYQTDLEVWLNYSPPSLGGEQTTLLRGLDRIDFESGKKSSNPQSDREWDLLFVCGPNRFEGLRALGDSYWHEKGVADFQQTGYRELRDANYNKVKNPNTGNFDFYYAHMSNVPSINHIFFIKTTEGNIVKLQILDYELYDNNPDVCRNMKIKYEVFPRVSDPPKPIPPGK